MVISKSFRIPLLWSLTLSYLLLIVAPPNGAQVLSDGDVGNPNVNSTLGTFVNTVGDTSNITGGTRPGGGQNLFHSFSQFDVAAGHTAFFTTAGDPDLAPATANIFGRITNGNPSSIFGTVDTATVFSEASLWLMNPAGFIFGPNSELNVAGTFAAVTANSLAFGDGTMFPAIPDAAADGLLSVSNVVAMEFLGSDTPVMAAGSKAAIEVQGLEPVFAKKVGGILLVGRDAQPGPGGPVVPGIRVEGELQTNGGDITIASVDSPGTAILGSINLENFQKLGQVNLIGDGHLPSISIDASPRGVSATGGKIVIRGGQLRLEPFDPNGYGGGIGTSANDPNPDPVVDIHMTETINLEGGGVSGGQGKTVVVAGGDVMLKESSIGSSFASELVLAAGGDLTLENSLLRNDATFTSMAGDITVSAGGDLTVKNSLIRTVSQGGDGAGLVTLAGKDVVVTESTINSFASDNGTGLGTAANAGSTVLSGDTITLDRVNIISTVLGSNSSGNAGSITTTGMGGEGTLPQEVTITNSTLNTVTSGTGAGGQIFLGASGSNTLTLTDSTLNATVHDQGPMGEGGLASIILTSPNLFLTRSTVTAETTGSRKAGDIILRANSIQARDTTLSSSSTGTGPADLSISLDFGLGPEGTTNIERLSAFLLSPLYRIDLFENVGLIPSERTSVQFDDRAPIQVSDEGRPFDGPILRPTQDMSALIGSPLTGEWLLNLGRGSSKPETAGPAELLSWSLIAGNQVFLAQDVPQNLLVAGSSAQTTINLSSGQVVGQIPETLATGDAGNITIQGLGGEGTLPTEATFTDSTLTTEALGTGGGGTISLGASGPNTLTLNHTEISAIVNNVPDGVLHDTGLGNIILDGPRIQFLGGGNTPTTILASSSGTRDAGQITFKNEQGDLEVTGLARLDTSSNRSKAGDFLFEGRGNVTLTDFVLQTENNFTDIFSEVRGGGGSVTFRSGNILTLNNLQINAIVEDVPEGIPSNTELASVTLASPIVRTTDVKIFATTQGTRDAGRIIAQADNLEVTNSRWSTTSAGQGKAGSITTEGFGGAGTLPTEVTITGSVLETEAQGTAEGGSILIGASGGNTLTLNNTVVTATVNDVAVSADPDSGLANIEFSSPTVNITGGGVTASSTGTRQGGSITMTATQSANLTNTQVSVESSGPANAGDILIEGGGTAQFENTLVSSEALQASGGNIKANAEQLIFLNNSTFSANVQGSIDTVGGTISLDPQFIILRNSQLLATALFGSGGTVELIADVILIDPTSVIDVSSQFGTSGTITVSSPIQNLSGAIAPLPESIVDVAQLVGAHCAAQQGGKLSTFVEAGRDVVPPGPSDYLTSPLFLVQPAQGNLQGFNKEANNLAAQRLGMTVGNELMTWLSASDSLHFMGSPKCYS